MRNLLLRLVTILLVSASALAQAGSPVSVTSSGWTVTADGEKGIVKITHDKLGTVMKGIRLNLKEGDDLRPLKGWSAESQVHDRMSIRTDQPRIVWRFELGTNTLKISSTLGTAVLTAEVPAPPERIVARLLDPGGVPVKWDGNSEVPDAHGGSQSCYPSFLPQHNPECMYFALGQISSSLFHDLFDRKTDTAIDFPYETVLERDRQNQNELRAMIPVPGNTMIRVIPDYFVKTLDLPLYTPLDDSYFKTAPTAWNSWDGYFSEVTERDIVENTDWIASHLKPYGLKYIVLDDGYDHGKQEEHYWIENWDRKKFPHGPQWLANYIKSKGLLPGLWIVPNAYAGAMKQHPDWYLRDRNGKYVLDYRTLALDSTNPEVLEFLKQEFTKLDQWGFDYYKFDGEYAIPEYLPDVDKDHLYDKSVDPLVAYRNRLKLIRATIGPQRFIEGCPAGTPLNGIGYFDSYFNGHDMYGSWQGQYPLFSSINANAFLNHIVVYVMPGEGIDVGRQMSVEEIERKRARSVVQIVRTHENPMVGFGVTLPESRTLVTYLALSGVAYSVASVMPDLPEERAKLLQVTLPPLPILPIDLFSRGTEARWDTFKHTTPDDYIHNYPEVLDLKVNAEAGTFDVVGMTNWRSQPITRELNFSRKLGLGSGSHVVFDFWNQKLYGTFKDRLTAEIQPHDTRVFLIHPLRDRPYLLGTSRHISGAYSVLKLAWDASSNRLGGSSGTVEGENYTLWIYVPQQFAVSQLSANLEPDRAVPLLHQLVGNLLSVTFRGQSKRVSWKIDFNRRTEATRGEERTRN